jgi:hypothetical protein
MRKDSCALVWLLNVPIARLVHTKLLLVLFLSIVLDELASLERGPRDLVIYPGEITQSDFSCFPARLPVPEWIEFTEAL